MPARVNAGKHGVEHASGAGIEAVATDAAFIAHPMVHVFVQFVEDLQLRLEVQMERALADTLKSSPHRQRSPDDRNRRRNPGRITHPARPRERATLVPHRRRARSGSHHRCLGPGQSGAGTGGLCAHGAGLASRLRAEPSPAIQRRRGHPVARTGHDAQQSVSLRPSRGHRCRPPGAAR